MSLTILKLRFMKIVTLYIHKYTVCDLRYDTTSLLEDIDEYLKGEGYVKRC